METGPRLKVSSDRLVKPGIEPATPGLLGKRLIHYTTAAPAKVDRSHYIIRLSHHKLIRNFNLFQPYKFSKFSDRVYTCIVNNFYTDTQNNLCIIW